MTPDMIYWTFLLLSCGYSAILGGVDGRRIAVIYVVGSLLTIPAQRTMVVWLHLQTAVALVDTAALICLFAVAVLSRRWWPIWIAGFQLNTVATHAAAIFAPSFAPRIYFAMESFWALPALIFLVVGVTKDRRAGMTSTKQRAPDGLHRA